MAVTDMDTGMVTPTMGMGMGTGMDITMHTATVITMVMVMVAAGGMVTGMAGADHAGRGEHR